MATLATIACTQTDAQGITALGQNKVFLEGKAIEKNSDFLKRYGNVKFEPDVEVSPDETFRARGIKPESIQAAREAAIRLKNLCGGACAITWAGPASPQVGTSPVLIDPKAFSLLGGDVQTRQAATDCDVDHPYYQTIKHKCMSHQDVVNGMDR